MHAICYTVLTGKFYHQFENKYTILRVEGVSDLTYELFYCVYISMNQIQTKPGHLVQWNCGFSWYLKLLGITINMYIWGHWVCHVWTVYWFSLNNVVRFILYKIFFTVIYI